MNLDKIKNIDEEVKEHKRNVTVSISLETIGALLTILFIILKSLGVMEITWFWVFFPLWIIPAAVFGLALVIFIITLPLFFKASKEDE